MALSGEISAGMDKHLGHTNIQLSLRWNSFFHSSPKTKIIQINYRIAEVPCSTNYFISRDSLSHYAVCKALAVAKRQHNGVGKVLLEESKLKFCLCRGGRAINLLIFKRSLHGNVLPSTGKKKKRLCSRG